MAKSFRFIPLVAAALFVASPARPDSLGHYRDQLGSRARMEPLARERVTRVRRLLGTQDLRFAAAAEATGPFRAPARGTDNGSKTSSSGVIKQFLQRAANDLKRLEQHERPPTVSPQTFLGEVERQQEARRMSFCQTTLFSRFPQLVDEYVGYIVRRNNAGAVPVVTNAAVTARQRLLAEYLRQQPAAAADATIEARLGALDAAEYKDGQLTALTFARRNGGTLTSAIPLSLSMLATYRSGDDEYFVAMLRCFATYLRDRVEGRRRGPEARAKLDLVLPDVAEKIIGAERVTQTLATLTRGQLNFLVDIFLQAGGAEFPAEEEMGMPENLARWNRQENPSVVGLFADLTQRNPNAASVVTDYLYYGVQSEQLSRLEDALQAEADMRRRSRQVIEGMRR